MLFWQPLLKNGQVLFTADPNFRTTVIAPAYHFDAATGRFTALGSPRATLRMTPSVLFDPSTSRFRYSGAMINPRYNYAATLLVDGRVLFFTGWALGTERPIASAELYDPATGRFTATGSMSLPRMHDTATRLLNGKVLVAGGCSNGYPPDAILKTAELYDPATGSFDLTGSMPTPRCKQDALLLRDGRVLILGGYSQGVNRPLIYDPDTGKFSDAPGTWPKGWIGPDQAIRLEDGRVLLTGIGASFSRQAGLYDPSTGRYSETGPMTVSRVGYSTTLLKDGRVLIVGGEGEPVLGGEGPVSGPFRPMLSPLNTAELYNPQTGTFTPTAPVPVPASWPYIGLRLFCAPVLLPNGQVLFVGAPLAQKTAALYDPPTGSFRLIDGMIIPPGQASATLLNDGRVLLVGGGKETCFGMYGEIAKGDCQSVEEELGKQAELYDPSTGKFTVIQTGLSG
jgi:hypothetical protein